MCGIAGFVDSGHAPAKARRIVQAMTARLVHRGPDGGGFYADTYAALGHRRLAIIDPKGGAQPLFNEDGTLAVVFNGEIYNYPALAQQLKALGHHFTTVADTEVLIHGYEEWGTALPAHLRGMFAFALWDARARRLFCARDDFGIKPLYYYQKGGTLLFASEVKALEPHPQFVKALDLSRMPDLLSIEYLPGPETFFTGVRELLPGQTLTWHAGHLSLSEPHPPHFASEPGVLLADWARRIDAAVADSVQAHSLADVKVGCFLSGGVDSAYITAHAAKVIPRLQCFSVGYAEQDCSELAAARRTAALLGVPLQETLVTAQDFFTAIPAVQAALEEPMANPAAVPLYFLCRDAARQGKVVLSGEGADELFGGYPLYRQGVHNQAWGRLPLWLRRVLAKSFPQSGFLRRGALPDWQRCVRANYVFADWHKRNALLAIPGQDPARCFRPYFTAAMAGDEATALQWVDQQTWLPFDILRKADRMSMAHGLELRVPFLDPVVRAPALALPRKYRVRRTADKIALRAAAGQVLPPELTQRRKRGFPVPLAAWLRQDQYYALVRDAFTDTAAAQFFDRAALLALLDAHCTGKVSAMGPIFSLYSFLVWYTEVFQK